MNGTKIVSDKIRENAKRLIQTAWGTCPTIERIAGYSRDYRPLESMITEIDNATMDKIQEELRNNYVCLIEGDVKREIGSDHFDAGITAQAAFCRSLGIKAPNTIAA